jgi:hypothetical protein
LPDSGLRTPVTDKIIANASSYNIIICDRGKVDKTNKQTDIKRAAPTSVLAYTTGATISTVDLPIQPFVVKPHGYLVYIPYKYGSHRSTIYRVEIEIQTSKV